jgi:serine/threonine-protein kinase
MGLVQAALGDRDEAIRRLQRAVELEPRSADAVRELANGYDAAGRRDEAERTYLRAIALQPDSWEAHTDAGIFYFKHGEFEAALRQFERVVDLTPDNYRAYANLGATYFSLSRHDEAANALQRSIALRPTDLAYANLGTAFFYAGRYDDARAAYRKAVDMNRSEPRWWGFLGNADRWGGRPADATNDYRTAIALLDKQLAVNSRDAEGWARLGMHLAAVGERKRAPEALATARQLGPRDGKVLFESALGYEDLGERGRALDALRLALDAGFPRIDIEKAPLLEKLRKDPAYGALQRATDRPVNPR